MLTQLKRIPRGKQVSARDLDKAIERLNLLAKISGMADTKVTTGPTGIQIKGGREGGVNSTSRLFQVQSSATGDAVYNTFEQFVSATNWVSTTDAINKVVAKDAVNVEVWNTHGNYIKESPYAEGLFANDLMVGWQTIDDENNERIVGIPAIPTMVRLAYVQEDSPADLFISVKLADNTGVAAGDAFDAQCIVYGGLALDEAVPRLSVSSGDFVFVIHLLGKWFVISAFLATTDCTCGA